MERNKGNLLNLLYLFSLPSTPQIKSYVDHFDSPEELKEKNPELNQQFKPKEKQGQYLNLILRGYDDHDRLVQISVVQTVQQEDPSYLSFRVNQAEEELLKKARKNNLNPKECVLAVKGYFFYDIEDPNLGDLVQGKYKRTASQTEVLNPCNLSL